MTNSIYLPIFAASYRIYFQNFSGFCLFARLNILFCLFLLLFTEELFCQWERVPLYGGSCSRLIVNRYSQNQIFALTEYSGLFFSNDTGKTWKAINGKDRILAGEKIVDLEITKDNKIFIPLWSRKLNQYTYLASDDFGTTWQKHQCPDSSYAFDFESCDDGTIYLFLRDSGPKIYKSTNNGTTWYKIILPDTLQTIIRSIYVQRANSKVLFLIGINNYILRSDDGGMNWKQIRDILFNSMNVPVSYKYSTQYKLFAHTLSSRNGNRYVDIYCSDNDGTTWDKVNRQEFQVPFFKDQLPTPIVILNSGNLIQIVGNMLYTSVDTGKTWMIINPIQNKIWDIAKAYKTLVGSFSFSGMQCSNDEGMTWTPSTTNYGVFYDNKLAIANSNVFFSIVDEQSEMRSQLRQSTDAGYTWKELFDAPVLGYLRILNTPSPRYFVIKNDPLSVDSKSAGMLLTGTIGQEIPDTLIKIDSVASPGGGYYYDTFDLQISPLNHNIIYFEIMTHDYIRKLFVSSNSGTNWEEKTIPKALFSEFSLYPSYIDTCVLYGAGGQAFSTQDWGIGIWRSSNYGATWQWLKWYDPYNEFRLLRKDIFYDGTNSSFSSDTGSNWIINTNGLPNIYLNPLRIRSFYSNHTLFCTTPACNYYQYNGSAWNDIAGDNDLKLPTDNDAYGSSELFVYGSSLYVSYNYDGLYVNRNSVTAIKDIHNDLSLSELYDLRTYPNPFSNYVNIFIALKQQSFVKASIFTITGKCIRIIFYNTVEKGYYNISWDGRDEKGYLQQGGLYFCRIETETCGGGLS